MPLKRALPLLFVACSPASSPPARPARATPPPTVAQPIASDAVYNAFAEDGGISIASDAEAADAGAVSAQPEVTVRVLVRGRAPRRSFTYAFVAAPRSQRWNVTMSSGSSPQSFDLTLLVTPQIGADGATFDVKVTALHIGRTPKLSEQSAAQLEAAVVGQGGSFDATNDGRSTAFAGRSLSGAASQIVEAIMPLCLDTDLVAWPKDPIGVGAKWSAVASYAGPAVGTVTTTFVLEKLDATTATVSIVAAGARTMPATDSRAPAGTTVTSAVSGTSHVVARRDGIARSFESSSRTVVTQRVPSQPDQSVAVMATVKADSR